MITHLEPDILECEVKWALGNIMTNKASGKNGISGEGNGNPFQYSCLGNPPWMEEPGMLQSMGLFRVGHD